MRVSLYDLASVDSSWEENSVLEVITFHCRSPVGPWAGVCLGGLAELPAESTVRVSLLDHAGLKLGCGGVASCPPPSPWARAHSSATELGITPECPLCCQAPVQDWSLCSCEGGEGHSGLPVLSPP